MDYRARPRAKYIMETEWNELYVLNEHWISDLKFYQEDLRFLDHLIDKYFIRITKKENIDSVNNILVDVLKAIKLCEELLKRTYDHHKHIEEIIESPFTYDSHQFREEHQALEDDIASFIKLYRKTRKKTFDITEHVIDSEQLKLILAK